MISILLSSKFEYGLFMDRMGISHTIACGAGLFYTSECFVSGDMIIFVVL